MPDSFEKSSSSPFLFGFLDPVFPIPYYFRRVSIKNHSAGTDFHCFRILLNKNPYAEFPSFGGFANETLGRRIKRKDTVSILIFVIFA